MAVDLRIDNGIATVLLNRPEAMNAINHEMRKRLRDAWAEIRENDDVRVAIISGAGDKAFSAGADLKEIAEDGATFARRLFYIGDDHLVADLMTMPKPLIAAVNGYAIGGGLELALVCDLRIAADTAQFGLSEVRVGSIPGAAGTQLLPRLMNRATATKMLLTGDRIDAQEALRSGLVSDVVPRTELMPLARRLAERIGQNPPMSVRAIKVLASRGADVPLEHGVFMERLAFALLWGTEDHLEGRRAFLEKRAPEYQGR